jgi:hypothetical protein
MMLRLSPRSRFFGRGVGPRTDNGHYGKGKHDECDMAMPAMPAEGFVVVKTELVLGRFEAVL